MWYKRQVYRSFEDVADFREELDRLERDMPVDNQLPLLEGETATGIARKKR